MVKVVKFLIPGLDSEVKD